MDANLTKVLYVDLDGTLIRSDLLVESVFALLKSNFLYIFMFPLWLWKGRAHLKTEIANRVELDATTLPYHEVFLDFLRKEHLRGRTLVLATASNRKFALQVVEHLAIFDSFLASDEVTNLSGRRKLAAIQTHCGGGEFSYAGDSRVDEPIWQHAESIIVVGSDRFAITTARRSGKVEKEFTDALRVFPIQHLRALRLHQWLKNLLIFIPLTMAHQVTDVGLLLDATLAFVSFGLCASSVYLLNDLLDVSDDRNHPTKRLRPFAAGTVPVLHGLVLIPVLLAFSFSISLYLPIEFSAVLGFYYLTTLAYSFRLKRASLVDVLTLAGLYTVRIIAGAAAVLVTPSFWLLAFSMFLFLSLALVKRYTELLTLKQNEGSSSAGRGYRIGDLPTLSEFGSASAYMAVLVLALYINSETVRELYSRPEVIWLLCPLLLYMITRVWLLARRDELHEDPVVFFIRDRRSQWMVALGAVLLWIAI
jgi:4-hydroxybenzoate polyprenyltransferase